MQKYKQAALAIAFLSAIFTFGLSANALALTRPTSTPSQSARIQETFEDNDFDSWCRLIGSKRNFEPLIDKNLFEKFIAARQAARRGDYDTALKLSKDLKSDIDSMQTPVQGA